MAATPLTRYPRPSVAVDIAVLTAVPDPSGRGSGQLAVLVHQPAGGTAGRALPGRFLREGQTIAQSVVDVLEVKAGLQDIQAEARLLRVFDDPDRDPRGWTISLAHSLTLTSSLLQQSTGTLVGVTTSGELESDESLLFDHDEIVREAAAAIRDRYERSPDPDGLLDDAFTMAELKRVHESVLGERLLKDTFRRRMEPNLQPLIDSEGVPTVRSDGGRPAQVFARRKDLPSPAIAQRQLLLPRVTR